MGGLIQFSALPPPLPRQPRGASRRPHGRKQRSKGRYLLMKRNQRFPCRRGRCLGGCAGDRRAGRRGRLSRESPRSLPEGLGAPPGTLGHSCGPHGEVRTPDEERPFKAAEGGHSGRLGTEAAAALQLSHPFALRDFRVAAAPQGTPAPASAPTDASCLDPGAPGGPTGPWTRAGSWLCLHFPREPGWAENSRGLSLPFCAVGGPGPSLPG